VRSHMAGDDPYGSFVMGVPLRSAVRAFNFIKVYGTLRSMEAGRL